MVVGYHRRGIHPLDVRHGLTLLEPQNKRVYKLGERVSGTSPYYGCGY